MEKLLNWEVGEVFIEIYSTLLLMRCEDNSKMNTIEGQPKTNINDKWQVLGWCLICYINMIRTNFYYLLESIRVTANWVWVGI